MSESRRRQFLIASGALLVAPLARAQPRVIRLGLLTNVLPLLPVIMDPLAAGLRIRGWVEGLYVRPHPECSLCPYRYKGGKPKCK